MAMDPLIWRDNNFISKELRKASTDSIFLPVLHSVQDSLSIYSALFE